MLTTNKTSTLYITNLCEGNHRLRVAPLTRVQYYGENFQILKSPGHEQRFYLLCGILIFQRPLSPNRWKITEHYNGVMMGTMASQITNLTIVYFNRLFGCRSKKTSKLRVTGLCAGNSPGNCEFPEQMSSNAESVSIWWRHHEMQTHLCVSSNKFRPISVKCVRFIAVQSYSLQFCFCPCLSVIFPHHLVIQTDFRCQVISGQPVDKRACSGH